MQIRAAKSEPYTFPASVNQRIMRLYNIAEPDYKVLCAVACHHSIDDSKYLRKLAQADHPFVRFSRFAQTWEATDFGYQCLDIIVKTQPRLRKSRGAVLQM